MDRLTALKLFGTDETPGEALRLVAGPLQVAIRDGAVRGLWWHGTEVLRGIDYPIRDENWGTYPAERQPPDVSQGDEGLEYRQRFTAGPFEGVFHCQGTASGEFQAQVSLTCRQPARVNRAGFVVLHPVAGFAGSVLEVTHADGSRESTRFPEAISPSQPVFDIRKLRQDANGVSAEIEFGGEIFEMEDQRNWSDASYKTYCRPLSLPYPYTVAPGGVVSQSIRIHLSGSGNAAAEGEDPALAIGSPTGQPVPEMGLALEPDWAPRPDASPVAQLLDPSFTLLRLDLQAGDGPGITALEPSLAGAFDLEMIVGDSVPEIGSQLRRLREALDARGLLPRTVTALPHAFLKSYQPDGRWPEGATPHDASVVAREVFPETLVGDGVLTNFTELNRYRAAIGAGDFVTHGTTAIVHAADDLSVVQTLEALPQIFASAETLAGGRPYRLGLLSIGMRSNPYGAALAPNREQVRRPMAGADPRQRGLFGAAWMVGAVAATENSAAVSLAVGAPCGPFGLVSQPGAEARALYDEDAERVVYPAFQVFRGLRRIANRPRLRLRAGSGLFGVAAKTPPGVQIVLANLSPEPRSLTLPQRGEWLRLDTETFEAAVRDPDWLDTAPRASGGGIDLPGYATAFVTLDGDGNS